MNISLKIGSIIIVIIFLIWLWWHHHKKLNTNPNRFDQNEQQGLFLKDQSQVQQPIQQKQKTQKKSSS